MGDTALAIRADVTSAADLAALHDRLKDAFGPPTGATDEAMYDRQMNVNVKGVFFSIRAVLPLMPKGGSIILNTSWLN